MLMKFLLFLYSLQKISSFPKFVVNRVICKVIGSFGVQYFRDSLYAVSLSVTGKYPKFTKIPHP